MSTQDPATALLEQARNLARLGRIPQAEQCYLQVLRIAPEHPEALNFLAICAGAKGDAAAALNLLQRVLRIYPNDPATLKALGTTYADLGKFEEAEKALRKAVALAPDFFAARLSLGQILEGAGRTEDAVYAYFGAIFAAQAQGQWLDDAIEPPVLRQIVLHAKDLVGEHRSRIFEEVLQPLSAQYGKDALGRVEQALQAHLGRLRLRYADPRQRPKFFYVPGLPATPYLDLKQLPWVEQLESNASLIRDEALRVLSEQREAFQPFLKYNEETQLDSHLRGSRGKPAWDAFFFYRHGQRFDDNCKRCPTTAAILESLPLLRIPDHAPEICFSVLAPGTHLLPHYGVTNTRTVVHLPLIVPGDCALRVGGEIHEWREGKCVAFDDTFEHEAWNRSDRLRVVLILDTWNPGLSQAEREAVAALVTAIGIFNRKCGIGTEF